MKASIVLLTLIASLAASPAFSQQAAPAQGDYKVGDRLLQGEKGVEGQFREITWDDLIPADWRPDDLFKDLKLESLSDQDPRAMEAMEKLREAWDNAPVVDRLNGQRIRIPGFVVPLEGDGKAIREFLLVPYFGACIHVPPPPANQLIHVMPDKPIPGELNMVPVWVNGILTVARFNSDMGNAGYQLRGIQVEEYKDTAPR